MYTGNARNNKIYSNLKYNRNRVQYIVGSDDRECANKIAE